MAHQFVEAHVHEYPNAPVVGIDGVPVLQRSVDGAVAKYHPLLLQQTPGIQANVLHATAEAGFASRQSASESIEPV